MAAAFAENEMMERFDDRAATRSAEKRIDDPIVRDAARAAVSNIVDHVISLGGTDQQAIGVQEAVRLSLLNDFSAARNQLSGAGFDEEIIAVLMQDLLRLAA